MTSTRSGGEWTEPRIVTTFKDSTIMVGHPAISPDGQSLYFVSDYRGQSFGGKDIFVCQKIGGSWSVPENLGDRINTTGNEMFPYVANDGTLYFASDGHQGFGGLDIYSARKDSIGRWVVRNMLAPMNSPNDDFGITFKGDEANGFFSSNRGNTKNVDNIYWFSLPEITFVIEGTITDENGVPLDATVKIVGNDGSIIKQRAKKNGSYRVKLKENVNYVMMASNRGYLNSSKGVTTVNEKESRVFKRNFKLPSIASSPVLCSNISYRTPLLMTLFLTPVKASTLPYSSSIGRWSTLRFRQTLGKTHEARGQRRQMSKFLPRRRYIFAEGPPRSLI